MKQEDIEECLKEKTLKWFRRKLTVWGKENLRIFPWRQTTDPYKIFVAEFLLQQTDAARVVPIYKQFLDKYPSLRSLADASILEIAEMLKPLGFHYRASRLHQAARKIIEDLADGGKIPDDEVKLLKLPGVGKYMARSICANAFGQPVAVLDTNISRILQRFFGLKPHLSRARDDPFFWKIAQRVAPKTNVGLWNLTLIDFGAAICTFREPHCSKCPIRQRCKYNNLQASAIES